MESFRVVIWEVEPNAKTRLGSRLLDADGLVHCEMADPLRKSSSAVASVY
jgi:hypothetical protein